MTYTVIIHYAGEEVCLGCVSMEEAEQVRQSFVNWGGMGYDIRIEER